MQILITGAGGFVGAHLIQHLQQEFPDATIHGTTHSGITETLPSGVVAHAIDLREPEQVFALMDTLRPQHIYHLAAQSFVPRSFKDPWETLENNIRSQLNIIEACIALELKPRMLIISSAEIYGPMQPHELPITEESPLRPTNPYSVSKIAQDLLAFQYFTSHKLPMIRVRAFNHFGPGQSERFVAPAFGMQVARIEAGLQDPVMKVGNLSAKRDFTDVRDVVRAYRLLIDKGQPGDVYNVCSGSAHSAQEIVDHFIAMSRVKPSVEIDPERLRPVEIPIIYGSAARLQAHTGWKPSIPFAQSLSDILNDCRQRVKNQQGA